MTLTITVEYKQKVFENFVLYDKLKDKDPNIFHELRHFIMNQGAYTYDELYQRIIKEADRLKAERKQAYHFINADKQTNEISIGNKSYIFPIIRVAKTI